MDSSTAYSFVTCQHGAEATLKQALCEPNGSYRLSYSQKGFITFKSSNLKDLWSRELPSTPFVRSRSHALTRLAGSSSNDLLAQLLPIAKSLDWQIMHVWERDPFDIGWHGFEPGFSALASSIAEMLKEALQLNGDARWSAINQSAEIGQRVLDVVLVQPNCWWIGTHSVNDIADGWPGGVPTIHPPADMISRAYLKIAEAIQWSQMPIHSGDYVVEIGSAPGGSCQRLLELGMHVTGIDPGEMSPDVLAHPRFTHIRARSPQVKRRAFRPFRWLVCDANVAPRYTLDTVEGIVTYPITQIDGMLLTIKLSDWEQAKEWPQHLARVKSWGFSHVKARQLSHNRREYCIAAKR